jgi:putative hemolysin
MGPMDPVPPNDGFAIELALIAVLLALNAFFAGTEMAIITARRTRIRARAQAGDRRAMAVERLKNDPDRFLAAVQIGVTLVGTLASAVGGVAAVERLEPLFASLPAPVVARAAEPLAVGVVVCFLTILSLVVGELVPKSLAVRHADAIAPWVARPIEWWARLARFAVSGLTAVTRLVLKLFGHTAPTQSGFHTVEDLRAIVDEADQQGVLDGDVVKGAVELHGRDVRQLMTPRNRVVGLPRQATIEEALRVVGESGYSRFPAYADDLDHADGIVYARDLYEAHRRGQRGDLTPFVRPALIVPASRSAAALLAEMRRARRHMALVVDEHGSNLGLVTLEDILEVIVGDIKDEHDEPDQDVQVLDRDRLRVDGVVEIRELNSRHGLALPESSGYVTVAGLLLDRLGVLPQGGEVVEVEGYRLTVEAMEGRRIARVGIEAVRTPQPA